MAKDNKYEQIKLEQALKLYMAGYSFDAIACEMDFENVKDLKNSIFQLLEKNPETHEFSIKLEAARLEKLQEHIWPFTFDSTDPKRQLSAISSVLKIMAQRAKLLGLNKNPALDLKQELKNRVTVIWDPFEKKS